MIDFSIIPNWIIALLSFLLLKNLISSENNENDRDEKCKTKTKQILPVHYLSKLLWKTKLFIIRRLSDNIPFVNTFLWMLANRRSNDLHQSIVDELVLREQTKLRNSRVLFQNNYEGVGDGEVIEEKKDCDEKNSCNKKIVDDEPPINIFCLDGGGSKGEFME